MHLQRSRSHKVTYLYKWQQLLQLFPSDDFMLLPNTLDHIPLKPVSFSWLGNSHNTNLSETPWSPNFSISRDITLSVKNHIKQLNLFPSEKFDYFSLIYMVFFSLPLVNSDFEIPFGSRKSEADCVLNGKKNFHCIWYWISLSLIWILYFDDWDIYL